MRKHKKDWHILIPNLGATRRGFLALPRDLIRKTILLTLSAQLSLLPLSPCSAQDPSPPDRNIERLTNEILRKEIDLERFYLKYRAIGTKEPKFRRLRYFLLQVASSATTMGANVTFIKLAADSLKSKGVTDFGEGDSERNRDDTNDAGDKPEAGEGTDPDAAEGTSQPQAAPNQSTSQSNQSTDQSLLNSEEEQESNSTVKKAMVAGLIGTIFDGGSSCIELCSNGYTAIKNIMKKRNPGAAVNQVVFRIKEIDALSAERDKLIQNNPDLKAIGIYRAEGRVLRSFRNWCLSEFADVYADVKSLQSSYNVYYLFDIIADSMYVASYILGLKSLDPGKARLGGPALQVGIVGDSFGISAVPASTVAYNWFYKFWRGKLKKKLQEELKESEDEAKAAMANLDKEIASTDLATLTAARSVQDRTAAYALWSSRYDRYIEKSMIELRHQGIVAEQSLISGPAISGSYLAQSITGAVAFYRKSRRAQSAANLALAGSIASTGGTASSLALTNWFLIDELLNRRKLRKNKQLPEQLLAERLKTLDELEAMLVSSNGKDRTISLRNRMMWQ